MKNMKKQILNKLPESTIEQIKDVLSVCIECNVWFEYGEYHVSGGIGIKSHYAPDHMFIGTFVPSDLFTKEEQRENMRRALTPVLD